MSGETDLLDGLIAVLVAAGIGVHNSDPTVVYTADQVGIVTGNIPSAPDQVIALTPFPVQDDAKLNNSIIGIRLKMRGTVNPNSVINMAGSVFNVWQGLERQDFGSMHLAMMWRQSGQLDGQDDKLRWYRLETWYARCNVPTLYRTE